MAPPETPSGLEGPLGGQATTLDDFLGGRLRLRQPAGGFRAGLDSVILAAAVEARPGDLLFEPGMGVGVASLCAAHRLPGTRIIGAEMDRGAAALARVNIRANGMSGRVEVVEADVGALPTPLAEASFDHVFLNPPFQPDGSGTRPPDASRARAHMEQGGELETWLGIALARVKDKGRVTLVHRADRLERILGILDGALGEIVLHPLWPMTGRPAKRVLITGRRGVRGGLTLSPGLVLHRADGQPSPRLDAIARHGAPFIPDGPETGAATDCGPMPTGKGR
ncbi:MAG: tRNA1(Val) (adenine(37)-N6)-methyltransferase [Alphaproteobacteria bacterium]